MGVVILRRPTEDGGKTGLGRYADAVGACMGDATAVETDLSVKRGLFNFIINGIVRPFFMAKAADSADSVFHATDELAAFPFPFLRGRRTLTVHHVVHEGDSGPLFRAIWHFVTRHVISCCDSVIAVSSRTADDLKCMGVDPERIHVIPNPISQVFCPAGDEERTVIGCVGELNERKNISAAVDAFAALLSMSGTEELRMVVCGKGKLRPSLDLQIAELGISDRVSFVEDIPDEEMAGFYRSCLLLFNTSKHEGFGFPILEAEACGTPVLYLRDSDIPPEVVALSIPCSGTDDMAMQAHTLLTDVSRYSEASRSAAEYARSVSGDFCFRTRAAVFGR